MSYEGNMFAVLDKSAAGPVQSSAAKPKQAPKKPSLPKKAPKPKSDKKPAGKDQSKDNKKPRDNKGPAKKSGPRGDRKDRDGKPYKPRSGSKDTRGPRGDRKDRPPRRDGERRGPRGDRKDRPPRKPAAEVGGIPAENPQEESLYEQKKEHHTLKSESKEHKNKEIYQQRRAKGKREKPKHSGTGRRDTQKKGGKGGANWGDPTTSQIEGEAVAEAEVKEDSRYPRETPEEREARLKAEAEERERQEKMITFDQYKKNQSKSKSSKPLRKVEPADLSGFKKVESKAADNLDLGFAALKSDDSKKKKKKEGKKNKPVKLEVNFRVKSDRPPRREGQEGRTGGRRRNFNNKKTREREIPELELKDPEDFPTLGA